MSKRSFSLTLACAALASLALAAPSQAGSTMVTTDVTFSVPAGDTVSGLTVTYAPGVDPISPNPPTITMFGGTTGDVISEASNTVHISFNPIAATTGLLEWQFTTGTTIPPNIDLSGFSFTATTGSVSDTIRVTSSSITTGAETAPEPTTVALLGIGMTGLLAFRRFFKRASVA
jgi:hypothetical protein